MTKNDLIIRVLRKLRELEADETGSSEDVSLVGAKYDEVYAELNEAGLVNWASTGSIPNTHAQHVITIVAYRSADDFYVDEQRYQRLKFEAEGADGNGGAMARLRQMEYIPYVSTDNPVYF